MRSKLVWIKWKQIKIFFRTQIFQCFYPSSHFLSTGLVRSDFQKLHFFKDSSFFTLSHISNLPTVDIVLLKLSYERLFLVLSYRNQQSTASLSRVSLHEPEVLNLVLYLYQVLINWQSIYHEFNVALLSLGQIIGVPQNAKTSNVCASMSLVLGD